MVSSYADINWLLDQMKLDLRAAYAEDDPEPYLSRLQRNAETIAQWAQQTLLDKDVEF